MLREYYKFFGQQQIKNEVMSPETFTSSNVITNTV